MTHGLVPELVLGDITRLRVDAVVNAANTSLLGGGGVDGAIHRAAGRGLVAECEALGGCRTGEAAITGGYDLPARFVIHAVGPVWTGGRHNEPDLLQSCYRRALALAAGHGVETIAFPGISTGVYRFPLDEAARLSLAAVRAAEPGSVRRVLFCCFSPAAVAAHGRAFAETGLGVPDATPVEHWR